MNNHKINALFLATTVAIFSQSAVASPDNYVHKNGSTIVNINKADANGLSHNMWESLNVSNKGMVLNNSMEDMLRETGNIARNSHLDSAAKIILNEVISNKATMLGGFIEVAGQKADVIIANPNGITCSGCSFINTGRTTLTTGSPTFSKGTLTGFDVTKGTITVKGNGLQSTNYTELLAQKINIHGMINTMSLKAVAGVYKYDLASGAVTGDAKSRQGTSIDVSSLGGATAGVIQLQTTEAGAGVNNNGILTASALNISSNGALTNSGKINSSIIKIASHGKLTNRGALSGNQMEFVSNNSIINSGTMDADNNITLFGLGNIANEVNGKLNAGGNIELVAVAGDIENKGALSTSGSLRAQAGYGAVEGQVKAVANTSVINSGSIKAAGNIDLIGVREITLKSGSMTAGGKSSLTAAKVFNNGTVFSKDIIAVGNEFENTGAIVATNGLNITGKNRITNNGSLTAHSLSVVSEGQIKNYTCSWFILCKAGTVTAEKMTVSAPKMKKFSDIGGDLLVSSFEINKPVKLP